MELFGIHDDRGVEDWNLESSSSKGRCQLLISKYWSEVMRVYTGIVATSLFWVDVRISSERIGLCSKFPGQKWITMLNCERYSDQGTWRRVTSFVITKYSKVLWLVTMSIGDVGPLR
jgi:hypothetical protein